MDVADYGVSPSVDALLKDIERFDLLKHVVELEAYGVTVLPPEKLQASPGFIERLRDAILRTCEKRNGVVIGDPRTADPPIADLYRNCWDLLEEDEVFVEAATNPVALTLVRWLLGQSAIFSGQTWIIKGNKEGRFLNLHNDAHGVPPGAGQIAHMCVTSWLCTDYASEADGPTVFAPGTHKYSRAVLPHEGNLPDAPFKTFPLISPAGSLAIWNAATWHGSLPRTNQGLRVALFQHYARSYMRPHHLYDRHLSPQFLEKFPELERIVGKPLYPYADPQNVDFSRLLPAVIPGMDPFA